MAAAEVPPIPEREFNIGLPQPTDPFIQKYYSGREALIEQEKSTRSDAAFRSSLTPIANEACAIVARIRTEEQNSVWSTYLEGPGSGVDPAGAFPGMMFGLAKDKMERTKLWQIVRKMPKGALLHAHFDAMIDVDWLIEKVLETQGMGIIAQEGLYNSQTMEKGGFQFQYANEASFSKPQAVSIWSEEYTPGSIVPVIKAADSFPSGGREGFKNWVRSRCTISEEESLDHHLGLDAIWRRFQSCFPILTSMIFYEPIFRSALRRLLGQLLEDGIRWVDFRMCFLFQYRREGREEPEQDYMEMFRVFQEEVQTFQASEEGQGFWGCRYIWTVIRRNDTKQITDNMVKCIQVKKAFPQQVSGFDCVGQEDMGRSLADLVPEIFWFRKRCVEEGVDIPFFFHAGECLGDGDETDENLFDAILLGTRRIGHGFSLYKHPLLIEMVKKRSILIESCPISNEILRLTSSILSHPLPALLSRGVKCCLANDDPAILGHGKNGMTEDFWQALQGWENLGLAGLGSLAENSVRWAAYYPDQSSKEWTKDIQDGIYGEGIRGDRMREWADEWNRFCEWIVMEYAADYGSDEGDLK